MSKISSMGRGMQVVFAVGSRHGGGARGATVGDIAADLGKDRSQISRGLKAAQQEHFLLRGGHREYSLDWSLYTDAQLLTEQRLRTEGLTALEGLVEDTGEGCFLGVLNGDSTVTIGEHVPANSRMVGSWIGRPYPAYCSDAGQALLWDSGDAEVRAVFSHTEFVRHGPNTPAHLTTSLPAWPGRGSADIPWWMKRRSPPVLRGRPRTRLPRRDHRCLAGGRIKGAAGAEMRRDCRRGPEVGRPA